MGQGVPPPSKPGDTSELVGGPGGGPFRNVSPTGESVIGFRHSLGSWAGESALRQLDPLYSRDARGVGEAIWAREGYAVGGLNVDAGQFVNAVRIVFMRVTTDDRLDPSDSYTSEWIGQPTGGEPTSMGGTGARVTGVHGRRAAILDAIGLVFGSDSD